MATSEFEDASFKKYIEEQIAERDAVIAERDAEIECLKHDIAELRKKKGISSAREGLTFNDKTGTHTDPSGKHFCTKCLDKEKRNQLKPEPHGWRCVICDWFYEDPDNPEGPGQILDMGGGGPQGWMR